MRTHPKRRATLATPGRPPPRGCPRCQNQAQRALPHSPGKERSRHTRAGQQPRTNRTGPGQPRAREPRRCTPPARPENTSLAGTGWLVGLRSMPTDLTPSKSKGARSANTTLQPTSHPKKQSQNQSQNQKSKSRSKPITGTGAAKGAGQTRLRYRSSKGHRLNQPVAKTTAKRNRLNQRGQRRLQAVCVTTPGCAGIRA
jgi:hypothetical protein